MPIRTTITALAMMLLSLALFVSEQPTSYAQENLLQNPGFEGPGSYVDQRPGGVEESFAIAGGWNGWQTDTPSTAPWMNIPPIAFPHTGATVREGASQNIGRGSGTFTAAIYQTIGGVAEGTTFRFSTWVFQDNSAGNGAQTRIGIGSNVGGNPFGTPITWSPWLTAIDSWQEITVEATVPAGSITVFIYSTQRLPDSANQNYYDDAELINVGEGDVNVGDGSGEAGEGDEAAPPPPPTSTPQTFAPFVSAQGGDDSGRIVHTVQTGDTLAAIAVAYGVSASEILELNGITRDEARFLRIGQQLIISEGDPNAASSDDEAEDDESEETTDTESDDSESGGFASPTPAEVAAATEEPTSIPSPTPVPEEDTDDEGAETDEAEVEEEATEEKPTTIPEPTEIPATATDAPSAPVEQGEDADPLDIETGVCALMFEDANSNTIRDGEEGLLADGVIVLSDSAGAVIEEYTTDGENEPYCFEELAPGNYQMRATAPTGFGLASSTRAVNIQAGQAFTVSFGAIEGLEVAEVPTLMPDAEDDANAEIIEEDAGAANNLRNLAGILVLGLAGVVLVGGVAVGIVVGRN